MPTLAPVPSVITVIAGWNREDVLGQTVTLRGASGISSNEMDLLTTWVDWGDGTSERVTLIRATGAIVASHDYTAIGIYEVSVRVCTDGGSCALGTAWIFVDPAL